MAHRWGYSSVGRALLLHGRCQRFESAYLHNIERILEFENFITFKKSSKQELTMDTLVFRSDEGRGYQRNVSGNWKQVLIRKYPNKETSWTTSWIYKEARANLVNWNILVTRGKESKSDSLSSGERNGISLNSTFRGLRESCERSVIVRWNNWNIVPKRVKVL